MTTPSDSPSAELLTKIYTQVILNRQSTMPLSQTNTLTQG